MKWPELKITFVFPETYLNLLESYIENKKILEDLQRKNPGDDRLRKATMASKNALTPVIDANSRKITTNLTLGVQSEDRQSPKSSTNTKSGFSHTLEEILKQTKDISLIIESADENREHKEFIEIDKKKNE